MDRSLSKDHRIQGITTDLSSPGSCIYAIEYIDTLHMCIN
jgi:hypothetical protein